jgi:cell division septation protein DedD
LTSNKTHTFDLVAHYLKQSHSCKLQGFGDFQVHVVSSHVDPVARLFHPMNLALEFFQNSDSTSFDFIEFCSYIWETSTDNAESRIKSQIIESNNYLSSEGSFFISGLGLFTKSKDGSIHFKIDNENWVSGVSFGLPDLRFVPGANKLKTITIDRSAKPSDMEEISYAREQALKELRQMLEQANIAESGKSSKKIGAFPVIATVLTLILLINVILFLKKNPTSTIQSEIARMDMASETGKLIKDSVNPIELSSSIDVNNDTKLFNFNPGFAIKRGFIEFDSNNYFPIINLDVIPAMNEIHEQLKPEPLQIESPEVEEEVESVMETKPVIKNGSAAPLIGKINENTSSNAGFSLVAGAFKNVGNAQKLEKELKSLGYKNATVKKPKNHIYFLVFYESFSKREEAMKLQIQLESKGEEPWIFEAE